MCSVLFISHHYTSQNGLRIRTYTSVSRIRLETFIRIYVHTMDLQHDDDVAGVGG